MEEDHCIRTLLVIAALLLPLAATAQAGPGLARDLTLEHDGVTRRYDLRLPAGYTPATPVPLVLDLHGFSSNAAEQRGLSRWSGLGDGRGFAVAWPEAAGLAWNSNDRLPGDADDVGFLTALVATLVEELAIDPRRVYVTGLSNGGEMAQILACETRGIFAAFAPVASPFAPTLETTCDPPPGTPIILFRGQTDSLVPYSGGTGTFAGLTLETLSARRSLAFFAETNQCAGSTPDVRETIGPDTFCERFERCAENVAVELCSVVASPNFIPGHILYDNTDAFDIARRAWTFLSAYRSRGEVDGDDDAFAINAGLTGAWLDPATPGQGMLVEPIPSNGTFFAAWFTFDQAGAKLGAAEQAWFTLQGTVEGATAELEIFANRGGAFAAPGPVSTEAVGSATLVFEDCLTARFAYAFDAGPAGEMPLARLTPDTLCRAQAAAGTLPAREVAKADDFRINAGLSGAWLDPATAGQGLLFDIVPDENLVFMAWFTFAPASAKLGPPEARWLTAQGEIEGGTARLIVNRTTGGVFDDPAPVTTEPVGTATAAFLSCTEVRFTYDLPDEGVAGEIELVRLAPDVFCAERLPARR